MTIVRTVENCFDTISIMLGQIVIKNKVKSASKSIFFRNFVLICISHSDQGPSVAEAC